MPPEFDLAAYIRECLPVTPVPGLGISLHLATPSSGVGRLGGEPAYFAHLWGGGLALARHIVEHPETVRGRRVIDLGAGSGLVAIAAAKAGARHTVAIDIDPRALVAIGLNAGLNGVEVECRQGDLLDGEPRDADCVLAGDLAYDARLARRMVGFMRRCEALGQTCLIGDPFRKTLPVAELARVADYRVVDFGGGEGVTEAAVWRLAAADQDDIASGVS